MNGTRTTLMKCLVSIVPSTNTAGVDYLFTLFLTHNSLGRVRVEPCVIARGGQSFPKNMDFMDSVLVHLCF